MNKRYFHTIDLQFFINLRTARLILYIVSLSVLFIMLHYNPVFADKAAAANKQGIKAFNEQKFEESVDHFTEALVESPETPELKFNRGTALSALGKTEEAAGELLSSASRFENKEQSAAAHYNAGNAFLAANNVEAAIQEYKQAVKLDQVPEDIRHNLELALRKLNQQKQSQEQDKENSENQEKKDEEKKDEQDKQDQQNDQEEKEEQDKQDEQQSDKTQSPEDGKPQDQNEQPSNQQQNEEKPMTQEEAKRLLNAINDEEKRALSQRYMQMKSDMRQGDDW